MLASSAEAERSFSSLRRLNTWLRSTMTQPRLTHVCILNIHQDVLDSIDLQDIANQLIRRMSIGNKSLALHRQHAATLII
jgi:hypothetical protein